MNWEAEAAANHGGMRQPDNADTLDSTFATFFGATEETGGTGAVIREIKGESTEVVVDEVEREEFLAQARAERERRAREFDAMIAMEVWYEA